MFLFRYDFCNNLVLILKLSLTQYLLSKYTVLYCKRKCYLYGIPSTVL